ncbi:hypothetical protein Cgig2_000952 [Carnegiea gigantea]|uniref:Reverse transcriptase zinc-binding domain-containing protein n=1 Tax=Carnegiea gigantea TaxID=171969 RepID=A0A9Q1GWN0_9CARY|nr:hypothetical protein Cgig2_000952 [Carnegiea gigantea]
MFQPTNDASNTWKGILENVKTLQQGTKIEVRNGRQTYFWSQNWLGKGPLCNMVNQALKTTNGEDCKDQVVWADSSSDGCLITSKLAIRCLDTEAVIDPLWPKILKVAAPQQICFFHWFVVHDRIMMNVNRIRQNLTNDSLCKNYGAVEEHTPHLL